MITSSQGSEIKKPTRIILFDIDGTLIKDGGRPYEWCGRGVAQWQTFCQDIRALDETHGTHTLFGIATFKPEYQLMSKTRGDAVSDMVLAECGQPKEHSLVEFIEPSLIFFTNMSCKIDHAIKHVHDRHDHLSKDDIWIIDDSLELVIKPAQKAGFRAYHAKAFNHSVEAVTSLLASILHDVFEHAKRFSAQQLPNKLEQVLITFKAECQVDEQEKEVKNEEKLPAHKPLLIILREMMEMPQTTAFNILEQDTLKKLSPRKK